MINTNIYADLSSYSSSSVEEDSVAKKRKTEKKVGSVVASSVFSTPEKSTVYGTLKSSPGISVWSYRSPIQLEASSALSDLTTSTCQSPSSQLGAHQETSHHRNIFEQFEEASFEASQELHEFPQGYFDNIGIVEEVEAKEENNLKKCSDSGSLNSTNREVNSKRKRPSCYSSSESVKTQGSGGTTIAHQEFVEKLRNGDIKQEASNRKLEKIVQRIASNPSSTDYQLMREHERKYTKGATRNSVEAERKIHQAAKSPNGKVLRMWKKALKEFVINVDHILKSKEKNKTHGGFHFCSQRDAKYKKLTNKFFSSIGVLSAVYKEKRSTFPPLTITTEEDFLDVIRRALNNIVALEGTRALLQDEETGLFIEAYYDVDYAEEKSVIKSAFCPFAVIEPDDNSAVYEILRMEDNSRVQKTGEELVALANSVNHGNFSDSRAFHKDNLRFEEGEYVDISPALAQEFPRLRGLKGVYVKLLDSQKTMS